MNHFFIKPMLSAGQNDQHSDYQRLLNLCESYGLNQQETKQLMEEFKKGGYDKMDSMRSSLNQSMMSDHFQAMANQTLDARSQYKQNTVKYDNNFYQNEESDENHPAKSTDRYYGYEQEEHQHQKMTYHKQNNGHYAQYDSHDQSCNQMTFNNDQQIIPMDPKIINKKQSQSNRHINFIQPTQSPQNQSPSGANIYQNNKIKSPQSKQNPNHHISSSSEHSQKSQNSLNHSQLNPVYVKQLIYNFELLQKQNDELKLQISSLVDKNNLLENQLETVKNQHKKTLQEKQDFKIKNNLLQNEVNQLKAMLSSQKTRTDSFLSIKDRDSQIIQGLKDSIVQITSILKQKDAQNNDLQTKLIQMYQKNQKLSQNLYAQPQSQYNGGFSGQSFEKIESRKSLICQVDDKSEKENLVDEQVRGKQKQNQNMRRNESELKKQKSQNQGRRQLAQIIMNTMNTGQMKPLTVSQSNKQLNREGSVSRISQTEQNRTDKTKAGMPPKSRQAKENIFTGVQVDGGDSNKGSVNRNSVQDQSRRRGSSRVDIKKYKGMIEQLRNSYSNVGGNMIR